MSNELVLESLDQLLALDPPEQTVSLSTSIGSLVEMASRFRALWLDLISVAESLPEDRDDMSKSQLFERLLVVIGSNFDYAVTHILNDEGHDNRFSTAFVASDVDTVVAQIAKVRARIGDAGGARSIDIALLLACYLLANYILYLTAATALRMTAGSGAMPPMKKRDFHRQFSVSLSQIADRLGASPAGIAILARRIVRSGLRQASWIATEHAEASNANYYTPGPFSLVRPRDLVQLATKDRAMIRRYGEKGVEEEFESQLGYILQSLGFLTVPALRGERSVDHYCLSYERNSKVALLVDGKTTKGHYSLPTADERAFIEYAHDLETSMFTLPEPSLLLIVGPKSSSTLEEKLRRLDSAIRPSVRFLSAQLLADLRELTLGAIPSELFVTALKVEPFVVRDSFSERLAERLDEVQIAHQVMVRKVKQAWKPN